MKETPISREMMEKILESQHKVIQETLAPVGRLTDEISRLSTTIKDFQIATKESQNECRRCVKDYIKVNVEKPINKINTGMWKLIILVAGISSAITFAVSLLTGIIKFMP